MLTTTPNGFVYSGRPTTLSELELVKKDNEIFETTLYGLRTNLRAILAYLIPNSEISFYGEFVKIQSSEENPKDRLKQIEGVIFKK